MRIPDSLNVCRQYLNEMSMVILMLVAWTAFRTIDEQFIQSEQGLAGVFLAEISLGEWVTISLKLTIEGTK